MTTHQRQHDLTHLTPMSYVDEQLNSMSLWVKSLSHILEYVICTPHDHDGGAITVATEKIEV